MPGQVDYCCCCWHASEHEKHEQSHLLCGCRQLTQRCCILLDSQLYYSVCCCNKCPCCSHSSCCLLQLHCYYEVHMFVVLARLLPSRSRLAERDRLLERCSRVSGPDEQYPAGTWCKYIDFFCVCPDTGQACCAEAKVVAKNMLLTPTTAVKKVFLAHHTICAACLLLLVGVY